MKNNKLVIILAIILLFTQYLNYSKIRTLENQLSNLNNSIYRLDDHVDRISRNVSVSLHEFKLENAWTRKAQAEATHYNEKDQTATIDVEVEFNELRNDERILLHIQNSDGTPIESIDVTAEMNNGLNLNYSLDLPIDDDYALSVIGESAESKRSIDLGDVILKSMIRKFLIVDNFGWKVEYDDSGRYKSVGMDIFIHSFYEKEAFLVDYFKNRSIVSLTGEVYVDDVLVDTFDFLNHDNWTFSGIEIEGPKAETELPSKQNPPIPFFTFGNGSPDDMHISGLYTFPEPVSAEQDAQFFVIFEDSQGDKYSYPLTHLFE